MIAQSDAQPSDGLSRLLKRLRFCEDCLRAGDGVDQYFGWAGDQPQPSEYVTLPLVSSPAQSDAQPVGWQLVPIEPTEEMLDAADHAPDDNDWQAAMAKAYKAMLAAAPTPPALPEGAREALEWRFDIDNAPEYPDACWVGDSKSGVHIVCRRGQRNMRGVWYIAWANKMLPWLPDCWMPIPPSPPLRSRAAANRSAT